MLCIALGATLLMTLPADSFTLSWTHSVERVEWRETWRIDGNHLVAVEARVEGSGAGMEPPADAWRVPGGWAYRPAIGPLDRLVLAASPYAAPYTLCADGACRTLDVPAHAQVNAGPWLLYPCAGGGAASGDAPGAAPAPEPDAPPRSAGAARSE